jgi:DNA-binding response OmpR family regulator
MSDRKHILVVDDERDLVELIVYNLQRAGYQTTVAINGRQALDAVATFPPDLILLDLMLPELSGIEVAKRLRSAPATSEIPVIMLTAKGSESDQLQGLTIGADDYITKPFSMKVLQARIEAVLRRTAKQSTQRGHLQFGPVSLNTDTHQATVDGTPMKLTLTEFRLLCALVQASGKILSRSALMQRAMGPGVTVTERTIDVHVTSIRKKLGNSAGLVKTVRGVGYRLSEDLDPIDGMSGEGDLVADETL